MRVCEWVFSVGFGPGLESMSPARSRHSTSHAAGTHGWLNSQKNWVLLSSFYTISSSVRQCKVGVADWLCGYIAVICKTGLVLIAFWNES